MTNNMKAIIVTILLTVFAVGVIDLGLRAEEEGTCLESSGEWCGMMYVSRLTEAHEELTSCQAENPQQEHSDHVDGCLHDECDDSRDSFTKWVFPANSYLLRRVELSDEDHKLQQFLAVHIGGEPQQWPLPVKTLTEMGY